MTVAPDWINNHEIDTPPTPLTSHGPAMCYYNNDAYVLYIGQHGKNIWSLKNEGENTQVKMGQQTPRSSFRPALAVFDGMLHMVYVGEEGRSLWWSWFDGTSWHGNVQLPFAAYEPQPSLAAFGGALHLVWHDSDVPNRLLKKSVAAQDSA